MEGPWAIWQREQQYQPPIDVSPDPFLQWPVLKRPCSAVGWQNRLGFFVQYWLLCLETDEPNTSAWDRSPVQSAGFWTERERWGWQVQLRGFSLRVQVGKSAYVFRSSEVGSCLTIHKSPGHAVNYTLFANHRNTQCVYLLKGSEWFLFLKQKNVKV